MYFLTSFYMLSFLYFHNNLRSMCIVTSRHSMYSLTPMYFLTSLYMQSSLYFYSMYFLTPMYFLTLSCSPLMGLNCWRSSAVWPSSCTMLLKKEKFMQKLETELILNLFPLISEVLYFLTSEVIYFLTIKKNCWKEIWKGLINFRKTN